MRGTLLTLCLILLLAYPASALTWHKADFCFPCHQKYSKDQPYAGQLPVPVVDTTVIYAKPCSGSRCHTSNPDYAAPGQHDRWTLHMRVCGDCHRALPNSTQLDIHAIHLRFEDLSNVGIGGMVLNRQPVKCRTCHWSTAGYNNTPVAYVPPFDNLFAGNSTILNNSLRVPPWKKDCGYCHPMAANANRPHDLHRRVIIEVCPVCHGSSILAQEGLVDRIASGRQPEDEGPQETPPPSNEFSRLFERIADDILAIYRAFSG